MIKLITIVTSLVLALGMNSLVHAKEITRLYGGVLIEGYDFNKDVGPKGTIAYNADANEFRGAYYGLKMPPGRRAIFAWVHDTVNQKSAYLGAVSWISKTGKGSFAFKASEQFKGGDFGSYEIVGFTAEETGSLNGSEVVTRPTEPSGTRTISKPAFYLFSALPGADTERHYCGHGQDFFYAKAPDKQICYDCICGQKYSNCIAAGLSAH